MEKKKNINIMKNITDEKVQMPLQLYNDLYIFSNP